MANNFDWEAEDGEAFDEKEYQEGHHQGGRPRLRRPILILIAVALLLLSGALAFRQLGQRVDDTAGAVEGAIGSSHALILSAARSGDLELLANVLSGRQLEWTDAQLDLMRGGLFYDRRPLGLEWDPDASGEIVDITVSPDLQSAEVVALQDYLVQGNPSERVTLEHTSVYRRSGDRWLLSPPTFDFWGEKVSTRGLLVELSVLERDEALGLHIAADLEATITAACSSLRGLDCPPDTHVEVNLLADPTLFLEMEPAESRLQGSRYLNLPTPTLIGLPVDESGFRAIYRGYAERTLSALLGDLVDWTCCDRAHFYEALLDAQLSQLGLKRWPTTIEEYHSISQQSIGLNQLRDLWLQDVDGADALTEFDAGVAYAFVEFLTFGQKRVPAAQLQRTLSSSVTLDDWLADLFPDTISLEPEWDRFLRSKIGNTIAVD